MAGKKPKENAHDLRSYDAAYDRAPFDRPELDTYKTLRPMGFANIIDYWERAVIDLSHAIIGGNKAEYSSLADKYSLTKTGNLLQLAMEDRGISSDAIIRVCQLLEQAACGFEVTIKEGWLDEMLVTIEHLKTKLALELGAQAEGKAQSDDRRAPPETSSVDDPAAPLSSASLAKRFGVPAEALRKRLDRFRRAHGDGFMEVDNRKPQEPQYLYRLQDVRWVIDALKASGRTSSKRPARKKKR